MPEKSIRQYIQTNFDQLLDTLTEVYEGNCSRFEQCLKKARFPLKKWWKTGATVDEAVDNFLRECEKFAKAEQVIRAFRKLVDDVQDNDVLSNALDQLQGIMGEAPAGGPKEQKQGRGKERAVGKKHSKVVFIEEIAKRLLSKERHKRPHICHNDEDEERECCVQKGTVALAKEVGNFDVETDRTLSLTDAMQTIENLAFTASKAKKLSYVDRTSLKHAILHLFKLVGIRKKEFKDLVTNNKPSLLDKLQKYREKTEVALLNKVREDYDKEDEDFEDFIKSLFGFMLSEKKPFGGKPLLSKYNVKENIGEIEYHTPRFKEEVLSFLHKNVKEAHTSVDKVMKPFD